MLSKTLRSFLAAKPQCSNILSQFSFAVPTTTRMFSSKYGQGLRKPSSRNNFSKFRSNDDAESKQNQSMGKTVSSSFKKNINKYNVERRDRYSSPVTDKAIDRDLDEEFSTGAAVPFDVFTRELFNKSKEEVYEELKTTQLAAEEAGFSANRIPWDFESKIEKQPVGDLVAATGIERIMKKEAVIQVVERYVQALEERNFAGLEQLLEPVFWKRFSEQLEDMKEKGYEVIVEKDESKETTVELFKVTNMFCVGVNSNRKKNKSENAYYIFDKVLEGVPTRHIIKKHLEGKEMAVIKIVLDLLVQTPVKVKIVDKNGEIIEEERKSENKYHHLRIENDVLEVSYKALKRNAKNEGELNVTSMHTYRHVFSQDKWKIIDFDNYMQGNEIVQPRKKLY